MGQDLVSGGLADFAETGFTCFRTGGERVQEGFVDQSGRDPIDVRPSRQPAGRAARDHDETLGETEIGQLAGDGFLDGGVDTFALVVG